MIVFYHIPKCAGTYVYNSFFEKMNYLSVTPNLESREPSVQLNMNVNPGKFLEFIHYHQNVCPKRETSNDYWIVFIRHPIERFVSAFNHFKFIRSQIKFLDELTIKEKDLKVALNNGINTYIDFFYENNENFLTKNDYTKIPFDQFDFIGFTDKINEDMIFLSKMFGLNNRYEKEWTNGSDLHGYKKEEPSDKSVRKLEEMLNEDIEIWHKLVSVRHLKISK